MAERVAGLSAAVDVTAGYDHSGALLSSGSLRCWGHGSVGQLGDNAIANSDLPAYMPRLS